MKKKKKTSNSPSKHAPRPSSAGNSRGGGTAYWGEADLEEPTAEAGRPIPVLLVGLLGLMVYWGALYLADYGGHFSPLVHNPSMTVADLKNLQPKSATDELTAEGAKVYKMYCSPCHQPTGLGAPGIAPPLAGSEWVNAPGPHRMIRIALNGLQGPITVKGQPFALAMPPWRDVMTDEQLAAVLSFVRGNKDWGNNASPVAVDEVKKVREETADRGIQWTADELEKITP